MDGAPQRPLLRYHGGKWRLAPWIVSHFPAHRCYVEPFGGGASVLLRKPRSYAEVYNELDAEIVNVFRVTRDQGEQLRRALDLTPFARDEFELSYQPSDDPVEQARRTIVRSFQGFGSASITGEVSGFRANSNRSYTTPAHDWRNYPDKLVALIERMRGVVIENRDAIRCMQHHDSADTLHYVDPPYVHSTRSGKRRNTDSGKSYRHELTDDQHEALFEALAALRGHVIVSGYRCALYDRLFAGWRRIDKIGLADGARPRVESLWLSPSLAATTPQGLFPDD